MYINQDPNEIMGAVATKTIYDISYFIKHNLTEDQQRSIDMKRLADVVTAAHPSGEAFRNVSTRFTEHVDDETNKLVKFIIVDIESTADLTKGDKRQIAKAMEDYMQDCLGVEAADMPDNAYQVYYRDTPLTTVIADKGRANLAYNMLSIMAENDVLVDIKGDRVPMFTSDISIMDKNGGRVKPDLDPEWFGSPDDNDKAKEAALDKQIQEGLESGMLHPDLYSRKQEAFLQEQYSLCSSDGDGLRVWFAPKVWDIDKAGDMQNLMTYGIDPSIKLFAEHDGGFAEIRGHIYIVNEDGDTLSDQLNKAWAHELTDQDDLDFADAVASIPTDTEQTELGR